MPTVSIPLSNTEPALTVAEKIALLEAEGAFNCKVTKVGDQYLITYDVKPKVGRPPKEIRG